jgi:hypothetical protein
VAETLAAQNWLSIAQQSQVEVVAFLHQVRFPSANGRNDEATVAPRVAA